MDTQQSKAEHKRAVCVVGVAGAPESRPYKVEVSVQKLGRWWRWLPRPCYKKVAVFNFHWEEIWHPRQAYTSLPADLDVGRLQSAIARAGDALVKIKVKYGCRKTSTTTPAAEFMRRLGEEEQDGFVLELSLANENYNAQEHQQAQGNTDATAEQEKAGGDTAEQEKAEGNTRRIGGKDWMCQCPTCKPELPWWRLIRARDWETLPVKPPTEMDTYVDLLAAECTIMKKEGDMLLRGKKSCVSELAALKAEMDRMESELDRAETAWASAVLEQGEPEESEQDPEEDTSYRDEELWRMLGQDSCQHE